ncbi:NfeD family protein [Streptomyces sp. DT224]|uniref:NfeD family protein n=1 Tax=Streptomyces sp. DT224 TaxID=3393426 RepID=UPI003CF97ED9
MTLFLGLGIAGVALLALSLIFDGILEGLFGGLLEGLFGGLVSLPVIAGFVSMLGFGGAIVLGTTGAGTLLATVAGIAAGLVAALLTWKFSRALMRDQTDATPRDEDLVGTSGSVVTAIPADGYGEVLLRLGGQLVKLSAKSTVPVARGAEVWVEASLSSTSVSVRPVER